MHIYDKQEKKVGESIGTTDFDLSSYANANGATGTVPRSEQTHHGQGLETQGAHRVQRLLQVDGQRDSPLLALPQSFHFFAVPFFLFLPFLFLPVPIPSHSLYLLLLCPNKSMFPSDQWQQVFLNHFL